MYIFKLIANALAPLTILGAILAYLVPELFMPIGPIFLWLFAATMFALGVVLEPDDLQDTLRRPQHIGLGVLTQYTVMPLLGFAVAFLSGLPAPLALGFIIVGCAPGAMASNVIVYLAGGAVAFSIAMTTVATVLSPLLTPTLVKLLGSALLPIPFVAMMLTIIKTVLLPLLLGMFVRRRLGQRLASAEAMAGWTWFMLSSVVMPS